MIMKAEPTAFVVLDVLGYGELMRQEPAEVFMLVKELLQASARNWLIQRDLDRFSHFSGSSHAPTIEYLQFSDTLLIWLRVEELVPEQLKSPSQLVQSVCYAASITLASFMATGIPLRGSVGFGPTYISRDPLFLVGGELYSSIKLGEMQTWAGVALHESAVKVLLSDSEDPFLIEYEVPMKHSGSARPKFAVDWVTCLSVESKLIPPWEQMFCSDDEKVKLKKEETQKFYEFVRSQSKSFPVYLSENTISNMQERLSRILSKP